MQQAIAFPEGIPVPGLKPSRLFAPLMHKPIEVELPELGLRELSILAQKRGQK